MSIESIPKSASKPEKTENQNDLSIYELAIDEKNRGDLANENDDHMEKEVEVLDEVIKKEIKDYAIDLFDKILSEKNYNRDNFSSIFQVQNNLNTIVGKEKKWQEERAYTKEFRNATKIFLEELLKFSKENKDDKNFENFSSIISDCFFSSDPSIANPLSLSDDFDFVSKATRMPEIQRSFGGKVPGQLIGKINFNYKQTKENDILIENFNRSSISEKLDKLHLLEILISDSMAWGEAFRKGKIKLESLLEKIKNEDESYFVNRYADIIGERISSEKENPTRGFVQYSNDFGNARLRDFLTEKEIKESEKLERTIYPENGLSSEEKMFKVGKDMIAVFDHSNIPVRFAKADLSSVQENETLISGRHLVEIKKFIEYKKEKINIDNLILYINENIFRSYSEIEKDDYEGLAEKWSKYSKNISKEEWKDFFILKDEIKNTKQKIVKYETDRYNETGEMNFNQTINFYEYFKENALHILDQDEYRNNPRLVQSYAEFINAYEEKDYEHAYAMIDRFVLVLKFDPKEILNENNNDNILGDLVFRYDNLHNVHRRNNEQGGRYVNKYNQDQYKKYKNDIFHLEDIRTKVFSDAENIFQNFGSDLIKIDNELKERMICVNFEDYNEMSKNNDFSFLRHADSKEIGLLLQHMHRPKMKNYIENELGIKLEEIPFIYQIYLLEFLADKSKREVESVKEFLNQGQNSEAKNNRIRSFLSLEGGAGMGKKILDIGERLKPENADAIFAKYAEIVDLTEKSRDELEELFKNKREITNEEINKIVLNLISKAGQILVDFSERVNVGGETDKEDLMRKLENYKADLILTASVYKSINKENINFEDLKGVEFEKKNATNLSDEDIDQMKNIYARNYEYSPKFQKAILDNFDNILKELGDKIEIYFYKDNGKIVAFNRFDAMKESRKYFGSFNVDPILSSSSIGSSLMKASLEKEAENNEIEADCIPETLISSKYIGGGCGFVVRKINSNYKNTGVALFNIERKENNKKYHYFNYSYKKIIEEHNSKNPNNQFSPDANRFILKFDPKSKELIDATEKLIEKDFVMSNYVFSKDCKEAYCAFEKEI
ncbi:MAG: hypothetical protein P1P85_05100 [Patescibacteria group bacterium]|nr:hypothetical protein [Patescibacteria group bacterium]